jgi:hypothetical protein
MGKADRRAGLTVGDHILGLDMDFGTVATRPNAKDDPAGADRGDDCRDRVYKHV